jgi:excisionase family DNA binding protein
MGAMEDPSQPRLLTIPQVAERLGLSTKSVRTKINNSEIPAVRLGVGKHAPIRVDERELDLYLYGYAVRP